jgi:transcriptional regulator NrdR family protein
MYENSIHNYTINLYVITFTILNNVICLVKVKKRNGKVEEFVESKIAAGVKGAGATAEEAERVAKAVSWDLGHETEITAEELSNMVVGSLKKINKAAADEFVKYRDRKLRTKKENK